MATPTPSTSSSSSSGPRQGRASQMSQQEDWIARKKAEIEAKKNDVGGAGSVDQYQRLEGGASSLAASAKNKKGPVVKNRWGFRGKSNVVESPSAAPKVAFSNDGSFMEQFKKMQQQNIKTEKPLDHGTVETVKPKEEVVKTEASPEEEEWYRQALVRAREFAQASKAGVTSPPNQALVKPEPSEGGQVSLAAPETKEANRAAQLQQNAELPTVVDELASLVAVNGDQVEVMARERNMEEKELLFLQNATGDLYLQYRAKVESLRRGFSEEGKRVRKGTRWGSEEDKIPLQVLPNPQLVGKSVELISYAQKVFGTTDLEEHQWKQCSDQLKMSMVYQHMLTKQQQMQQLAQQGKRKYEYDSDEETEGGTWEHKARKLEMEKTATDAAKLTDQAAGKHHIGDFLPPEELSKFLAKYEAVKNGEAYVESDYQENKLTESNMGFKMLQKMGWNEGSGLGANAQGITNPINQGNQSGDKKGLGTSTPHELEGDDDEFDAYRKRMMLAYRFRPNPLNNPRRAYY